MTDYSPVAIVGMAGRFPGAASVEEFWSLLLRGADTLRCFSRSELLARGVPEQVLDHPAWVPAGQVLDDADKFDASFFGIDAQEATLMDPQHRLFLQCAWTAMETAGYARTDNPYRERTGVFAACGIDGYLVHHLEGGGLKEPLDPGKLFLTEIGNEKDYIATRVAFHLDLGGPALTITSACSSGLAAVAQAMQSLIGRGCDMALAGAAALTFPNFGYCYHRGVIGSLDGRMRPFDQEASGTLFGDSVGAVVLKRLDDALADRDTIWAVLRGFGVSNDGRRKPSYTAPSARAQSRCIADALEMARVSPEQISYVECHATATPIGDAIELKGLAEAFKARRSDDRIVPESCAIGSVKGNIGHANCAAGITALIKTALCLRHRTLVPTVNFHSLGSELAAYVSHPQTPFYVQTGACPWTPRDPERQLPRRAGVSSFGIGGTNAHVVLEEPPEPVHVTPAAGASPETMQPRRTHLLLVSGKTPAALVRNLRRMALALELLPAGELAHVGFTLHLRREPFPWRAAFTAEGGIEAAELMRASADAGEGSLVAKRRATAAFCFPDAEVAPDVAFDPASREGIDDARLAGHLQRIYERTQFYLETALGSQTERAGAGTDADDPRNGALRAARLFVAQVAHARTLMDYGVKPIAVGGYGNGEYAAAVISEAMTLDAAAQLIAERARAPMSARPECAPGEQLTGSWCRPGEAAAPLRWPEGIAALRRLQPSVVLDFGDGATQSSLLSCMNAELPVEPGLSGRGNVCGTLGRLWIRGVAIDGAAYYQGQVDRAGMPVRNISLPGYSFERERFWVNSHASIYAEA